MATVIDELFVTLGLDASKFEKGQKDAASALIKTQSASSVAAKNMQADGAKAAEFFSRIKIEALGLVGVLAGTAGLGAVVASTAKGMADLGRTAKDIGISAQALGAFQNVIEQNGGSAASATASLQGFANKMQEIKTLGGNAAIYPFLNIAHIDRGDSPLQAYQKFVEYAQDHKDDLLRVNQVGAGLGFDQGTVNAAIQIGSVRDFLKSMSGAMRDVPTDKMIADNTKLQTSFERLKQAVEGVGNSIEADVAGPLTHFDDWVTQHIHDNPEAAKGLTEAGIGASALASAKLMIAGAKLVLKKLGMTAAADALGLILTTMDAVILPLFLSSDTADNDEAKAALAAKAQGPEAYQKWLDAHPNWIARMMQKMFGTEHAQTTGAIGNAAGDPTEAMDYFIGKGRTAAQAAGIVGNLQQESGLNPQAGKGTGHVGIAQWDINRQRDIERHFGKPVLSMSYREQLDAIQWELTEGKYKAIGDKLGTATSAAGAAYLVNHGYEVSVPAGGDWSVEDQRRQYNAQKALAAYGTAKAGPRVPHPWQLPTWQPGQSNLPFVPAPLTPVMPGPHAANDTTITIGSITVNTKATDAAGIGRDIRRSLADALVMQANRGLA